MYPADKGINRFYGHCYHATQALYYLIDSDELVSYSGTDYRGEKHWWLQHGETVYDCTAEQYWDVHQNPPYDTGKKSKWYGWKGRPQQVSLDLMVKVLGDRLKLDNTINFQYNYRVLRLLYMPKRKKEFNILDHIPFDSEELEDVELGFDPKSKEMKTFLMDITPEIAAYILAYHNNDNRNITMSQVIQIAQSIVDDGWLEDGQPLTFNIEGNITEFQHRLLAIVRANVTVRAVVVLGVQLDCFTKCAPAKPRRAEDEIERKDKTAKKREVSTLRQVLARRQGDKLSIKNAIDKWVLWKQNVRAGRDLVDGFFDATEEFDPWERTFAAWASLMVSIGEEKLAETFLSLLQEEMTGDNSYTLTKEFYDFFETHSPFMSNSGRTTLIWQLLCLASDRIQKQSDAKIQLGITIDKMNHDYLKKKGHYRKFLENADNIQISKVPF